MFKDYYLILDIEFLSSTKEIKKAYRRQSLKWHPDKNKKDTTAIFQDIVEAKFILMDLEAKEKYDVSYIKYKKKTKTKETTYTANSDFIIDDELLKKWINNAQRQSKEFVKKIISETKNTSVAGLKEAGNEFITMSFAFFIIFIIGLLFSNC